MQRKPRFKKKTDTGLCFLWSLVIFSLVFNGCLLGVVIVFGGFVGKDGKNGIDGINGINGVNGVNGIDGYVHPDSMVLSSLHVTTLHVDDVQIMNSLQTFGTVDLYGGDSDSQDSDSRRLLAKKRDHCTTCEQKFSDQNTCVNSCSSHIKLEKNGFGEVFHKCCQN